MKNDLTQRLADEHARQLASGGDGVHPLLSIRKHAMEHFSSVGLPAKSEDWKYTRLTDLFRVDLALDAAPLSDFSVEGLPKMEGFVAVCLNGQFSPQHSSLLDVDGVTVSGLADAVIENPSLASDTLGSIATIEDEAVVALNAAFSTDGVYIRVEDDVDLDIPIHVVNVLVADRPVLGHARHLFLIGASASATVVEHDLCLVQGRSLTNAVVEAHVGQRARLRHFRLQEKHGSDHVDSTYVRQEEKSEYRSCVVATGDGIVRNNLTVRLAGEHCETDLLGLSLATGSGHIDHHTLVDHAQPNCHSNELYKSILAGTAESVFRGKLLVRKDAQKTGAFQSNRNLLLSEDATANALPQLEIYADDVKCSHGATTGLLDQDALFYLRARGIPRPTARRMLIHAFIDEVVSEIDDEPVRLRVDEILDEFLDTATL
jgi:Fe-S cluster assembly protein SufD